EENHITGLCRHRFESQTLALQRTPLFADQPLLVPAGCDLEAPILDVGRIDRDHDGQEKRRIYTPSRLLILMRRETTAARQFEIDLIFEQDGLATEQRARPGDQITVAQQTVEPGMERTEILDPLYYPPPGLDQAVLVINHVAARRLRGGGD